jgi:acetyl-CoA carboxylase biotin carboxyl carrier protein
MGLGQRAGAGMAELKVVSEINGMVWKIEVAPGSAVEAGATLIILESMKMEIPVAAPRAGRVKALLVAEKDEVGEGQALVVLEV